MVIAMSQDIFTLFGGMTTENLMEIISESMDDFLYVFDIQNNFIIFITDGLTKRADLSGSTAGGGS